MDGCFQGPVEYNSGEGPTAVFSADLDGDGYDDLAVANYDSDDVSVLLNNRDATFQAPMVFPVGRYPVSVFAEDFNDDDDIDLAVANYFSDSISILINLDPHAAKPVPDGYWVEGIPVKAIKAAGGLLEVTWDSATCPADDYNIICGEGSFLSAYTPTGGACGIGKSGSVLWDPPELPGGEVLTWWILVGTDGGEVESSWGKNSEGSQRSEAPSGLCGVTVIDNDAPCP